MSQCAGEVSDTGADVMYEVQHKTGQPPIGNNWGVSKAITSHGQTKEKWIDKNIDQTVATQEQEEYCEKAQQQSS